MTFALVETDLCVKATESVWTAIPLDNGSPKIPVAIRETSIFSYFQRHFERRLRNRMWQLGNSQNKIESSFRATPDHSPAARPGIQEFQELLDAGPGSRPGQAFTGMTVRMPHTFSAKF
jgi:hypothetical protein